MDVFYFALCACLAAFVAIQLEFRSGYFSRFSRNLSIIVSIAGLGFLAHAILAIHTETDGGYAAWVFAVALLAVSLAHGLFAFIRPSEAPSPDEKIFPLVTAAIGLIRWFPLAAFAALCLLCVLFLRLFWRHRARALSREVRRHWLFPLLAVFVIIILTSLGAVSQQC